MHSTRTTTRRSSAAVVLAALLAFCPAGSLSAQEEDPVAEARELVDLCRDLVERGNYDEAERKLKRARKADAANEDAARLLARVYAETGRTAQALSALETAPGTAPVLLQRARLLLETGRHAEAEAIVSARLEAEPADVPARQLLGRALEETGRRDDAIVAYEAANDAWAQSEDQDTVDELLAVARARLGLFRLSDAYKPSLNSVLSRLDEARKLDERRVDVLIDIGDLYLQSYRDVSAKRWYTKAKDINRSYAPAIFGLAQQHAFRFDEELAREETNRALKYNPNYVPALLFLAQMDLGDERYEEARKSIDTALAANPMHAESLATKAAYLYMRGDAGYADVLKQVLERDAHASVVHRIVAVVLEEQRRFAEALEFAQKAIELDERDFEAFFMAGRNAMNVGRDDLAKKLLNKADDGDPFNNIYRANFIKLFDKMARFPTRKDTRFLVKLPPKEDEAYHPLLRDALGRSLDDLEKRWEFKPEYPLFISVFDQQQDFATRTIGLPGFPALGACFGRVVTLDSPRALPPGAFGWRGTLHHELAHVITLELSKGRVPRWLTEGLSVYEERKTSPQWNREMERTLIDAIASREVLPLGEINSAFRGSRVLFAYYQGGLMCEMVERDFGFPKLREMVRLYGEGLDTPNVVQQALGIDAAEFDKRFLAYAGEYVKDLKVLPRPSRGSVSRLRRELRKRKDDAKGWRMLALGYATRGGRGSADALSALSKAVLLEPEHPFIHVVRALIARAQGRTDQALEQAKIAIEKGEDWYEMQLILADHAIGVENFDEGKTRLRRMIELFPVAAGGNAPRVRLASLLMGEGEGKLDESMQLLRAHCDVDEDDFETRQKLAAYYRDKGNEDAELATLLELRDIVPLPHGPVTREDAVGMHTRMADLLAVRKRSAEEEVARRVAVGVGRMQLPPAGPGGPPPTLEDGEIADLLVSHARALRLLGRLDEARDRLREAIDLDPEHGAAADLLERLRTE